MKEAVFLLFLFIGPNESEVPMYYAYTTEDICQEAAKIRGGDMFRKAMKYRFDQDVTTIIGCFNEDDMYDEMDAYMKLEK